MKIGKIHVIYVYIKNQKQTDELPKSQVGCVLEEVCADWGDIYFDVMGATKRERKTLLAITIRAENLEAISHRL